MPQMLRLKATRRKGICELRFHYEHSAPDVSIGAEEDCIRHALSADVSLLESGSSESSALHSSNSQVASFILPFEVENYFPRSSKVWFQRPKPRAKCPEEKHEDNHQQSNDSPGSSASLEVESRDFKDLLKMTSQLRRDPDKLVGAKLERYEIQELIGIGGMGAVYRAQHEITRAKVAIKVLRPDLIISNEEGMGSNEEGMGFFFEKATNTASLQHPMIVKVLSADYTPDGSAYMVMEWLDGRTLDQEMKERGVFPQQRVIVLLEQIAEAVAYAHRKRIIHRDLKPSNIMLVREENGEESIRVLDFGVAKALSTTIGIGTNTRVAGTVYYISPEQTIAHSPIDQSADIYSLGVILYQLLTGQVPFEADTEGQVMDMHRSTLPRPPREIRPDIPQPIEDVVLKAMSKRRP